MAKIRLSNGVTTLDIDTDEDECETLGEVLDLYRETLNIPADANLAVNGDEAGADTPLSDGDVVTATKTAGSKGSF